MSALRPPPPALFPDAATRERIEDALTRALLSANARVAAGPVLPDFDREA